MPAFRRAELIHSTLKQPVPALQGFSMLFVTDIHASRHMFPPAAVRRLMDQLEDLRPDMILYGGDFAETPADRTWIFPMLGKLRPPYGAFAVPGNNDSCPADGVGALRKLMSDAGIALLVDAETDVPVNGAHIRIGGLNSHNLFTQPETPFFREADEQTFRLLLAHYPWHVSESASFCALPPHLALTGHTHGGQFRFFGLTPYSLGFELRERAGRVGIDGWSYEAGFPTLVSRGIGTSRLPFRLNAPPAVHMITLTV